MAVLGEVGADGRFVVEDVCYAGLPKQIERPLIQSDRYLTIDAQEISFSPTAK